MSAWERRELARTVAAYAAVLLFLLLAAWLGGIEASP